MRFRTPRRWQDDGGLIPRRARRTLRRRLRCAWRRRRRTTRLRGRRGWQRRRRLCERQRHREGNDGACCNRGEFHDERVRAPTQYSNAQCQVSRNLRACCLNRLKSARTTRVHDATQTSERSTSCLSAEEEFARHRPGLLRRALESAFREQMPTAHDVSDQHGCVRVRVTVPRVRRLCDA